MDRAPPNEFLYCLYGMYLAVLGAGMGVGQGNPVGSRDVLVSDKARPPPFRAFHSGDLVGLLPGEV